MNKEKINSYLNFAVKGNFILWGLDFIIKSKNKPIIIIYDKSIGNSSKKQLFRYCEQNNIQKFEVEENYLNNTLKREKVKIVGIIDQSLANAIISNWR